jgi:DNA repair protein RadC
MKTPQLQTIAEVNLVYRNKVKASERPKVKCSKDAHDIFIESWNPDSIEHIEEFKVLLMNPSNAVLGILNLSKGGLTGTVTDNRVVLQAAIKANAAGIIVCHNHPSGNVNPSESDTKSTMKLRDACNMMDIQLVDHLIITPEDEYYSFADNCVL